MKQQRFNIVLAMILLSAVTSGMAQTLRDPTLAPPEAGGSVGDPALKSPLGDEGMAVVMREGKPYLVVGARLYAPGQKVGQLRIDRITETEVWVRDGGELRKVPRFAGIRRTVTAEPAPCVPGATSQPPKQDAKFKSKSQSKSKAAPPVACDSTQP